MSQLLRQEKFADLDCIADNARARKDKFAGGLWKVHAVYAGIEAPQLHATEEDWKEQLALLQHWIDVNPKSITARVALADAYAGYGWEARGPGFADSVSASGWRQFGDDCKRRRTSWIRRPSCQQNAPSGIWQCRLWLEATRRISKKLMRYC
jgi:hypothetical protein